MSTNGVSLDSVRNFASNASQSGSAVEDNQQRNAELHDVEGRQRKVSVLKGAPLASSDRTGDLSAEEVRTKSLEERHVRAALSEADEAVEMVAVDDLDAAVAPNRAVQMEKLKEIASAALGSREGTRGGSGYLGLGEDGTPVKFLTHWRERMTFGSKKLTQEEKNFVNNSTNRLREALIGIANSLGRDVGDQVFRLLKAKQKGDVEFLSRETVAKAVSEIAKYLRDENGESFSWGTVVHAGTVPDTRVRTMFENRRHAKAANLAASVVDHEAFKTNTEVPAAGNVASEPNIKASVRHSEETESNVKTSILDSEETESNIMASLLDSEETEPRVEISILDNEETEPNVESSVVEDKEPEPSVAAPVVENKEPEPSVAAPVVENKEPEPNVAAPVVENKEPAPNVEAPVVENKEPAPNVAAPVVEGKEPEPNVAAPVVENKKPEPNVEAPAIKNVVSENAKKDDEVPQVNTENENTEISSRDGEIGADEIEMEIDSEAFEAVEGQVKSARSKLLNNDTGDMFSLDAVALTDAYKQYMDEDVKELDFLQAGLDAKKSKLLEFVRQELGQVQAFVDDDESGIPNMDRVRQGMACLLALREAYVHETGIEESVQLPDWQNYVVGEGTEQDDTSNEVPVFAKLNFHLVADQLMGTLEQQVNSDDASLEQFLNGLTNTVVRLDQFPEDPTTAGDFEAALDDEDLGGFFKANNSRAALQDSSLDELPDVAEKFQADLFDFLKAAVDSVEGEDVEERQTKLLNYALRLELARIATFCETSPLSEDEKALKAQAWMAALSFAHAAVVGSEQGDGPQKGLLAKIVAAGLDEGKEPTEEAIKVAKEHVTSLLEQNFTDDSEVALFVNQLQFRLPFHKEYGLVDAMRTKLFATDDGDVFVKSTCNMAKALWAFMMTAVDFEIGPEDPPEKRKALLLRIVRNEMEIASAFFKDSENEIGLSDRTRKCSALIQALREAYVAALADEEMPQDEIWGEILVGSQEDQEGSEPRTPIFGQPGYLFTGFELMDQLERLLPTQDDAMLGQFLERIQHSPSRFADVKVDEAVAEKLEEALDVNCEKELHVLVQMRQILMTASQEDIVREAPYLRDAYRAFLKEASMAFTNGVDETTIMTRAFRNEVKGGVDKMATHALRLELGRIADFYRETPQADDVTVLKCAVWAFMAQMETWMVLEDDDPFGERLYDEPTFKLFRELAKATSAPSPELVGHLKNSLDELFAGDYENENDLFKAATQWAEVWELFFPQA